MINLASEPSLGSMVISANAVWRYSYVLPTGMTFPTGGVNDVQTVSVGAATAGNFTLTFNGQTTVGIPYNASAATVQSALAALSNVGSGNVSVTGTAPTWVVTFQGALQALQPLMTINSATIVPSTLSGTPSTTGGTLAAGTYFWVRTALSAAGESTKSNEVTATLTGTTSSEALSWTQEAGDIGSKIYRGTAAGGENALIATISSGSTTTYTDTGTAGSAGTPPTVNGTGLTGGTPTVTHTTLGVVATSSQVVITDRAGGNLATLTGTVGTNEVDYQVDPSVLAGIPAGSNWELFVTFDDGDGTGGHTYAVRYGRVVRREPAYPLGPVSNTIFTAAMYEDTLDRSAVGPRWRNLSGSVGMHPSNVTPPPSYALGVRSINFFSPLTLYGQAGVLWYAPVNGDSVTVAFKLLPVTNGYGQTNIVVCSNYAMTKYLALQFNHQSSTNTAQFATGTGPTTLVLQGSTYTYSVTQSDVLQIKYDLPSNTASLYVNSNTAPVLQWTDTTNQLTHGAGYRYVGASWLGSLGPPPPLLWYWKAMDAV